LEDPYGFDFLGSLLTFGGITTLALYLAVIVRYQNTPVGQRAITWLAPAGRMPLTNYLLQSILMGLMLSGWGWGLGATLTRAELALLGLAIVAGQIMLSRIWIARFVVGPIEKCWRLVTYSKT
jgi:uncharacterized protein